MLELAHRHPDRHRGRPACRGAFPARPEAAVALLPPQGPVAGARPASGRVACRECGDSVPAYYVNADTLCVECQLAAGAPPDDDRPAKKTRRAGDLAHLSLWPPPPGVRFRTVGDTRWRRREPKVRRRSLRSLFAAGRGKG
jgi:hypothetical protein